MPIKAKRNSKAAIAVLKSKATDLLYIGMIIDDQPYKLWKLNDLSPAGVDFCNELMKAFDLGYSLEFQLPTMVDNVRQIVPLIYNLNDAEAEEANTGSSIKDAVSKIMRPADIPVFEKYDKGDAVLAGECGITDEFMDKIQKNADSSDVAFVVPAENSEPSNLTPIEESVSVFEPAPEVPVEPVPAPVIPIPAAPISEPAISSIGLSDSSVPSIPNEDEFFPVQTIEEPISVEPVYPDSNAAYLDVPPMPPEMTNSAAPASAHTQPQAVQPAQNDPFGDMFPPVKSYASVQPQPASVTGGTPVIPQPVYADDTEEDMAYCINGHKTPKKGKFCIHCGAKVLNFASEQPPQNRVILNNPYDTPVPNVETADVSDYGGYQEPSVMGGFLSSYKQQKT